MTTPNWNALDRLSSSHLNPYASLTDAELVEAMAHLVQTGRVPLPGVVKEADPTRLSDTELIRRIRQHPCRPKLNMYCSSCHEVTTQTRAAEGSAYCSVCYDIPKWEHQVRHWLAHLESDLASFTRDHVAGLLAEARRKLIVARSRAVASERRERGSQEELEPRPGPDRGNGLLGYLTDLSQEA